MGLILWQIDARPQRVGECESTGVSVSNVDDEIGVHGRLEGLGSRPEVHCPGVRAGHVNLEALSEVLQVDVGVVNVLTEVPIFVVFLRVGASGSDLGEMVHVGRIDRRGDGLS